MSDTTSRKLKVFPVLALLDFERELLLKAIDGFMLKNSEKAQLAKLVERMRKGGQG